MTMRHLLPIFALVLTLGACAHRMPPKPLPPGEWAYRYESGAVAYYDGHAWGYGVNRCASQPQPPLRRGPFLATAVPTTYQWVSPLTAASYGLLGTGGGVVYEAHCSVKTINTSETLYVMFVDTASSSQPTNGTAPIFGGVSGGMTTAGNDVTFSDQTNPVLVFTNGIMFAASTTPDTYTAPNAADVLRCDAKLRSTNP